MPTKQQLEILKGIEELSELAVTPAEKREVLRLLKELVRQISQADQSNPLGQQSLTDWIRPTYSIEQE